MKYKLTFALVAALTSTAFAGFQAPLPEFKNEKQLAEWRAEKASEATSQGYASEETAFYTGKPYLASSGDYAFKYRSYNPEMARWTSEDPSGFPDGANGNIYTPIPTSDVDFLGLWKVKMTTSGNGSSNKEFTWTDFIERFAVAGVLTSDTAPGTLATQITLTGMSSAQRGWGGDIDLETQTINQTYTVEVNSSGNLSISGTGTAKKSPNNVGIGIVGSKSVNGSSITLDYNIYGTFGTGAQLVASGFSVMGNGANAEWSNGVSYLDGFISVTFEAVE